MLPMGVQTNSKSDARGSQSGHSRASADTRSESQSQVPFLMPIFETVETSRQFYTPEEFKTRRAGEIAMQPNRNAFARMAGETLAVKFRTPDILPVRASKAQLEAYRLKCLRKFDFAKPRAEAEAAVAHVVVAQQQLEEKKVAEPMRSGRRMPPRAKVNVHVEGSEEN